MSKLIGFVILSHDNPQQLRRLVRCLQKIYDNPPIAIHHDFNQSSLSRDDFPSDVHFVQPYVRTQWGSLSVVIAFLQGLKLLYEKAAPAWFFLLSAADYPSMPADMVLGQLKTGTTDALLDYREVPNLSAAKYRNPFSVRISESSVEVGSWIIESFHSKPENPALEIFTLPKSLEAAWRRFLGISFWLPIIRSGPRVGRFRIHLPFEDWRSPFTPQFKCFSGDVWFAGNAKVAEILTNPNKQHLQLRRYLRFRQCTDECYHQTVLGNTPGLKITKATRRFADWSESAGMPRGGAHPKVLGINDLPAIISSKSYFARKFAPESRVLNEIDKMLL